jgi:phosphoglycerate dehydrogenase-like enzyme
LDTIDILCTMRFTDELLDALRAVSPSLRVTQRTGHNPGEVAAALQAEPGAEILYAFHLPLNVLELAPSLRWVQLHSAGADHLLDHPIMGSDVVVTTTSGIHATPIAEYVLASMLAYRWRVPLWTRCQRESRWPSERWSLFARPELRGGTVGVVGYGSIGREVGRLCKSFGMRVLAMRRSTGLADQGYAVEGTGDPGGTIPDRFYAPGALRQMLAECDYVVVALPLTAATRHIIGEPELRAMKPSAYLVNIARGGLIDEAALARALGEGRIGGAGLDVFEEEPLSADSPLWQLDNALISPHVAGFTPHYDERAVALFAGNLSRYLAGLPLQNQVDKKKGY